MSDEDHQDLPDEGRSRSGEIELDAAGVPSVVVGIGVGMEGGAAGVQLLVEDDRVEQALEVLGGQMKWSPADVSHSRYGRSGRRLESAGRGLGYGGAHGSRGTAWPRWAEELLALRKAVIARIFCSTPSVSSGMAPRRQHSRRRPLRPYLL